MSNKHTASKCSTCLKRNNRKEAESGETIQLTLLRHLWITLIAEGNTGCVEPARYSEIICRALAIPHSLGQELITTTKSMSPPKGDKTTSCLLTLTESYIENWSLHCGSNAPTEDTCSWFMHMYTSYAFFPSINIKLGINVSLQEHITETAQVKMQRI